MESRITEHLKWNFEPLPFWDEETQQWLPSVRITCNGEFYSWQAFYLGFDKPEYTMPYAHELCREMRDMNILSFASWMKNMRGKF